MPRKIKGVRRHGAGWQTFCRVNGEFRSATWSLDTPTSEMTEWLRQQRAEKLPHRVVARGIFQADAELYLQKVTALVSYKDRIREITLWSELFAGRRRRSITSAEIRGYRDAWLNDGYSASAVNHRLRALSNLWTVLDGRRAPNPVRDVEEAPEPEGEPRAVPYWLLRRLVARMPDVGRAAKGESKPPRSKTKARLALMMWTGLTHGEIGRLRRRDWDDVRGTLYVQGRRKGKGGASRLVPLQQEGRKAMRNFAAADAWGAFERSAFHASFRRACARVASERGISDHVKTLLDELRPYDVRHSHATAMYRATGDVQAVAEILGHRDRRTTRRYTQAAIEERAALAIESFEEHTRETRSRSSARIEHRPSKARVAGSSPAGSAIRVRKVASEKRQLAKRRRVS